MTHRLTTHDVYSRFKPSKLNAHKELKYAPKNVDGRIYIFSQEDITIGEEQKLLKLLELV